MPDEHITGLSSSAITGAISMLQLPQMSSMGKLEQPIRPAGKATIPGGPPQNEDPGGASGVAASTSSREPLGGVGQDRPPQTGLSYRAGRHHGCNTPQSGRAVIRNVAVGFDWLHARYHFGSAERRAVNWEPGSATGMGVCRCSCGRRCSHRRIVRKPPFPQGYDLFKLYTDSSQTGHGR